MYVYLKNSKCKAISKTIHKLFLFVTVSEAAPIWKCTFRDYSETIEEMKSISLLENKSKGCFHGLKRWYPWRTTI